jgi:quinol monooxygenase YgiN
VVIEIIRYEVPTARAQEFSDAYARAARVLDADEHCLAYEVVQGVEEPANWIVRIEWDSLEGHEQGFRKAPHFRVFFAEVRPFFSEIREMEHYDARLASARRQDGPSTSS